MTELHQKKEVKSTNSIHPILSGLAGMVAGGIVAAGAMIMSDKNNQKKIKNALNDVREKVTGYLDSILPEQEIDKSSEKLEDVATDTKQ